MPRRNAALEAGADPQNRMQHVYGVGVARIGEQVRDARDRFLASDPGWTRLRQGGRAVIAVGSTLLLELLLARSLGRPATLAVLLGAVVAMLMSTGIREARRAAIATTATAAPVVAATGAALGVLTAQQHVLGLVTFVVVSFSAVWVRRFGPRGFTLGFLGWQGFFFALFLHPPVSELPFLLLAVAVSGAWVAVLLLTVLYDNPQLKLRSIVAALRARARAGVAAALVVLDSGAEGRSIRHLRRQLVQLAEVALLLDAQLADPRALPDGVPPGRLRRWTVDVEIGMDEVALATAEIARRRAELPVETVAAVRTALQALGWGDHHAALRAAGRLADLPPEAGIGAVRRLAAAAGFLLDTVHRWDSGELSAWVDQAASSSPGAHPAGGTTAPAGQDRDLLDEDDEFESAVTLVGGNLPGSAGLAQQSIDRQDAGRSFARLRLTTRQAVQAGIAAGLAILAGEAISPARFYWAVIAAFVAFAGTATSGETVQKGAARIVGTVLGLIAAVGLANLTAGHRPATIAVILLCIGGAFFLQTVSYGAMVFFITVLLGQLYTLLGTFSDRLLELRLTETVVGAAIGVLVSLVVLPTHSRATLTIARQSFLRDLAELLEACATTLDGSVPPRDPLTLTMVLEASGRQLVRTRRALTKGRLFGSDRTGLRHRISVLGTCGASARALAASIATAPPDPDIAPAVAQAARELANEARRLADAPALSRPPALPPGVGDVLTRVQGLLDRTGSSVGAGAAIRRLGEALALLGSRPGRTAD